MKNSNYVIVIVMKGFHVGLMIKRHLCNEVIICVLQHQWECVFCKRCNTFPICPFIWMWMLSLVLTDNTNTTVYYSEPLRYIIPCKLWKLIWFIISVIDRELKINPLSTGFSKLGPGDPKAAHFCFCPSIKCQLIIINIIIPIPCCCRIILLLY
jgi:hypothetical protein